MHAKKKTDRVAKRKRQIHNFNWRFPFAFLKIDRTRK